MTRTIPLGAVQAFKERLRGQLVCPGDDGYDAAVDANVFKGYYTESVLNTVDPNLTGSVLPVFEVLGSRYRLFLDDGGQIKSEWLNVVGDDQWLNAWLSEKLVFDHVRLINVKVSAAQPLLKTLRSSGFPKSKDKWYIRTAFSARQYSSSGKSYLLSEDLDYYSPRNKGSLKGKSRKACMIKVKGPVPKILRKHDLYIVCCMSACIVC
jgi:hypothetical protein